MIKTGAEHLASLRDGRAVFLDGGRVEDATSHPAYRNAIVSFGRMFDFQCDPANRALMTFETETGTRANRIWQLPHSHAELVERRRALVAWAELHAGFLGRAPDHVASCISGMFMGLEQFEAYNPARAHALAEYYRYARDNDLYLTYVNATARFEIDRGEIPAWVAATSGERALPRSFSPTGQTLP